jgi:hypothetical protein
VISLHHHRSVFFSVLYFSHFAILSSQTSFLSVCLPSLHNLLSATNSIGEVIKCRYIQ